MIIKGLFVDFDDSFSHTIIAYFKKLGLDIVIVNHRDHNFFNIIIDFNFDYVVLGPGPGTLEDYKKVQSILSEYVFGRKKMIGICLGHQMIASMLGLQIKKYKRPIHGVSFKMNFKKPFISVNDRPIRVQFYNSWYVEYIEGSFSSVIFNEHEDKSLCALYSPFVLSYQFHPESVGTSCPDEFFVAMHNFLYNKDYEQKNTKIQRCIR